MRKSLLSIPLLFVGGCAATSDISMSPEELQQCLQPNRRVVVEVVGQVLKPPPKKPAAKPEAEAKPAEAKPAAEAKPKAAKPEFANFEHVVHLQGDTVFDPSGATLKDGGKKEIDELVALLKKRAVRVGAIIVSGHTDRLEAAAGNKALSEQRAVAVKDYLISQGADEKVIFWEGKEASVPVPVTKFCAS
jgi:OmpA-OmpF porin, OOP family